MDMGEYHMNFGSWGNKQAKTRNVMKNSQNLGKSKDLETLVAIINIQTNPGLGFVLSKTGFGRTVG